jgi:hypothetical protein
MLPSNTVSRVSLMTVSGSLMPLGNSPIVVRLRYTRPMSPVKNR